MKPIEYLPPVPPLYKPVGGVDDLADQFVDYAKEKILAAHNTAGTFVAWYVWDGAVWRTGESAADRVLRDFLRKTASLNGGNEVIERAVDEGFRSPDRFTRWARSDPRIVIDMDAFDPDPHLLNTPEGIYDLRTGDLHSHDPAYRMTQITAVSPAKDCDEWSTRIAGGNHLGYDVHGILQEPATREYVRRLFGQAMFGEVHENLFPVLVGSGGNGKGALYETIHHTLGGYSLIMSPKQIGGVGAADYELASLPGSRFVFMSETARGKIDTALVKQLTGGDPVTVRQIYGKPFTIDRPCWSVFLVTNHTPTPDVMDDGFGRRLKLIEFPEKFTDGATVDDNGLPGGRTPIKSYFRDRLAPEVLRWLIDAAIDYHATGLGSVPESVADATTTILEEADPVRQFVETQVILEPGSLTLSASLWDAWKAWCKEEREESGNISSFGADLARVLERMGQGMGADKPKKGMWTAARRKGWKNVKLRTVRDREAHDADRYRD